ncbi:MAG: protein-methionine-sulfoxide reductase heme-binding subunit MsrQ [Chloroflexota bacterium]
MAVQSMPGTAGRRAPAPHGGTPHQWLKPGIMVGGLAPVASVMLRAFAGRLNANPIAQVENELGLASLVFIVAGLACTPASRYLGWAWPARIRRQLGLFAFFYASLHFLCYLVLDQFFDWRTIAEDISSRPFITLGFVAFLLLVPLAITSTSGWVRRLGYRRWTSLHRLAYLAGILAVIHFIWRVKIDVSQPMTYAAVLAALLLARIAWLNRGRASQP